MLLVTALYPHHPSHVKIQIPQEKPAGSFQVPEHPRHRAGTPHFHHTLSMNAGVLPTQVPRTRSRRSFKMQRPAGTYSQL